MKAKAELNALIRKVTELQQTDPKMFTALVRVTDLAIENSQPKAIKEGGV